MGKVLISITRTKMQKLGNVSKDEFLAIGTKVELSHFFQLGLGK